jgi:REP element-mobilizing transposase RayT
MSRGNRRSTIFEDELDRLVFNEVIAETVRRYAVRIFSVCQMGNHYHAILDAPRDNLSYAMRHLNGEFAQASNRRHERTGHVFEARFRSVIVQWQSYLRRASRYVVRNPVRAKLVASPELWPWSTYRATVGDVPPPQWLYLDWLRDAFDTTSLAGAQAKFRAYVNTPANKDKPLDKRALAWGTEKFVSELRGLIGDMGNHGAIPRGWDLIARPKLPIVFAEWDSTRSQRDQLIEIAHVTHGYTFSDIAKFLDLHPSSVSAAYHRTSRRTRKVPTRQASDERG